MACVSGPHEVTREEEDEPFLSVSFLSSDDDIESVATPCSLPGARELPADFQEAEEDYRYSSCAGGRLTTRYCSRAVGRRLSSTKLRHTWCICQTESVGKSEAEVRVDLKHSRLSGKRQIFLDGQCVLTTYQQSITWTSHQPEHGKLGGSGCGTRLSLHSDRGSHTLRCEDVHGRRHEGADGSDSAEKLLSSPQSSPRSDGSDSSLPLPLFNNAGEDLVDRRFARESYLPCPQSSKSLPSMSSKLAGELSNGSHGGSRPPAAVADARRTPGMVRAISAPEFESEESEPSGVDPHRPVDPGEGARNARLGVGYSVASRLASWPATPAGARMRAAAPPPAAAQQTVVAWEEFPGISSNKEASQRESSGQATGSVAPALAESSSCSVCAESSSRLRKVSEENLRLRDENLELREVIAEKSAQLEALQARLALLEVRARVHPRRRGMMTTGEHQTGLPVEGLSDASSPSVDSDGPPKQNVPKDDRAPKGPSDQSKSGPAVVDASDLEDTLSHEELGCTRKLGLDIDAVQPQLLKSPIDQQECGPAFPPDDAVPLTEQLATEAEQDDIEDTLGGDELGATRQLGEVEHLEKCWPEATSPQVDETLEFEHDANIDAAFHSLDDREDLAGSFHELGATRQLGPIVDSDLHAAGVFLESPRTSRREAKGTQPGAMGPDLLSCERGQGTTQQPIQEVSGMKTPDFFGGINTPELCGMLQKAVSEPSGTRKGAYDDAAVVSTVTRRSISDASPSARTRRWNRPSRSSSRSGSLPPLSIPDASAQSVTQAKLDLDALGTQSFQKRVKDPGFPPVFSGRCFEESPLS